MKKGSFAGQLYREFYLARKSYVIGLIMFAVWALFGCLTLISFRHGNIGRLIDHIAGDNAVAGAFDAEGMQNDIKNALYLALKGFPSLMTMGFIFSGAEIAGKDENAMWQRYAKCTPVTPAMRSAAKTLMNFFAAAASLILSIGYISFIDALTGNSISYREIAVLITSVSVVTIMSVIAQAYIRFFKGMDKGMLALVITVVVVELIFIVFNKPEPGSDGKNIDLIEVCELIFPFTPMIFIGTLAVCFVLMYALYRRREK